MQESAVAIVILILTGLFTFQGLRDDKYQDRYAFGIDGILLGKQYDRMVTSGFLHIGWIHFGFNMIALLSFAYSLEILIGIPKMILLYFGSLIGGSLLALYVHRNHPDYMAVGASGAVSGVIFASIILFPDKGISLIGLPFEFPRWLLAGLFIAISIFGIKTGGGNIGHEAHLGGALAGILLAMFMEPDIAWQNWWMVMFTLLPISLFVFMIMMNPNTLLIENYWGDNVEKLKDLTKKREANAKTVDEILDKISRKGINSLTKAERKLLDDFNKKNR